MKVTQEVLDEIDKILPSVETLIYDCDRDVQFYVEYLESHLKEMYDYVEMLQQPSEEPTEALKELFKDDPDISIEIGDLSDWTDEIKQEN